MARSQNPMKVVKVPLNVVPNGENANLGKQEYNLRKAKW